MHLLDNNLVKAIPQSVVVMSYNLCQRNVNPTLLHKMVTISLILDYLISQSDTPRLKKWIRSHQTQNQFYSF